MYWFHCICNSADESLWIRTYVRRCVISKNGRSYMNPGVISAYKCHPGVISAYKYHPGVISTYVKCSPQCPLSY